MARKRLSDLLREEEQKGSEKSTAPEAENLSPPEHDAAEPVVEVTGEVVAPDDLASARVELRNAAAEPAPETKPAPTQPDETQAAIQAEFENTIEQLKTELKALQKQVQTAQTQEATLQKQIDQLKAETTAQQSKIQQLQTQSQTEVAQSEQLKTELEAAKQMILKLSQPAPVANQPARQSANQPAGQSARQSASKAPLKSTPSVIPSVRAAEPELDSKPVEMIVPPKPAPTGRPKLHQMELRKLLDHPTQPGSLPPMPSEAKKPEKEVKLSDADVGWMD